MSRFLSNFKISIKNLRATKMRTALTILGIVIGVTSVTTVLALAEGARNVVRGQVSDLGNNLLTIRPGKAIRDHAGNITSYDYLAAFGASTISERDLDTVIATEGIEHAAPLMLVTGSIKTDDKSASGSTIIGTTDLGDESLGLKIKSGEFLNNETTTETAVLGHSLALDLFGSDTAIGRSIAIRGKQFTVVGILDNFGSSATISTVFDLNRSAFIHMRAAKAFNQGIADLQQIDARIASDYDSRLVAENLQQKLIANHSGENDVTVLRPQETVQISDSLFNMLSGVISAIAAISIIVGGVGVMNIMLVSVTERTREIGIRKAVGATNQQILSQFLIEATVMSLAGGVIGLIAGYGLAYAIATTFGFLPGVAPYILWVSLGISLIVGLIFGAWPAIKAARKDPIEALRYFQ